MRKSDERQCTVLRYTVRNNSGDDQKWVFISEYTSGRTSGCFMEVDLHCCMFEYMCI